MVVTWTLRISTLSSLLCWLLERILSTENTIKKMSELGRVTYVDYCIDDDLGVLVRLSARLENGERWNGYVRGTEPYIFAPEDEPIPDKDYIERTEVGYESLFDHQLRKIVTRTPKQAGGLTDEFTWTGEGDVPYYRRVSIHDGLSGYIEIPETGEEYAGFPLVHIDDIDVDPKYESVIKPRISIADIEVEVPENSTFKEMQEEANKPINVICSYDTYEDEYTVFFYDKYDNIEPSDVSHYMEEQLKGTSIEEYLESDMELVIADSEVDMLNSYIKYVSERDFDLESGWNYVDFDRRYIRRRMKTLYNEGENIHPSWLSPFEKLSNSHDEHRKIVGRSPFDMMVAFVDKLTFSNWRSKSLEYVANEELGIGKIGDVDINDDWKNNPSRLVAYNIVDSILTVALDDKNDIHGFFYEMANVCSIPITDVFYEKRQIDGYLMSNRPDDEIHPTAEETEDINNAGGYVAEAANGRIENVGVSDLKSLYPSAMITWNLSPETLADTPKNFDEYIKVPKVPEPKDVEGEIEEDGIEFEWKYASFDQEGILPRNVKRLFEKRNREKEKMYEVEEGSAEYEKWNRKQGATKILMNSMYGVASSKYWRLSTQYLGDAITSTARYTLWKGKKTLDRLGYEHVYSDSVSGERLVVIRHVEDKSVDCIPISELWEEIDGRVTGEEKERKQCLQYEALSVNGKGESEWKPINEIIRHKTDKKLVELQQARGGSVTTTDHSYVFPVDGELTEKKPSEVKRPYRIDIPDSQSVDSIALSEYLDDYSIQANGIGRSEKVEKRVQEEDGELYFGESETSHYNRHTFCINEISGEVLESLVRLCGAYVADGSSSTHKTSDCGKWGLSIANEDVSWLEELKADYLDVFRGCDPCIVESDANDTREVDDISYNDETMKMQAMNRISAVVFQSLCGAKSTGKEVPSFIFNLPEKYKWQFIRSAVRGDGSNIFPRYSDEYAERNFSYCTQSLKLASGMSVLLNQLNVKHNIDYRDSKNTYEIRTADNYQNRDDDAVVKEVEGSEYVYDLSVEDNQNFADALGCVALHNTDSHMFKLPDGSVEEQVEELEWVSSQMDEDASEILSDCGYDDTHPFLKESNLHGDEYTCMLWEAEKFGTHLQLGRKKRYAQAIIWKEGRYYDEPKVSISGFENARSDSPEITASMQEKVIEKVLFGSDFEEISEYIQSVIDQIDESHVDVKKFALPGTINKDLEEYPNRQIPRACMWSNEHLNREFSEGDTPFVYFVKETPSDLPQTDVVALEWNEEIPDGFKLDEEAIIERAIRKPVEQIIESVGWNWKEIRSGRKVRTIDLTSD